VQRLTTVALTSGCAGGKPGRNGAKQCSRPDHESENDGNGAGASNVFVSSRDRISDPPFGIWGSQARHCRDKPDEIGTIVGLHAAMARSREKNAGSFGPNIVHVSFQALRSAVTAEQTIEVVRDNILARNGC
jgi:hypothetical protein